MKLSLPGKELLPHVLSIIKQKKDNDLHVKMTASSPVNKFKCQCNSGMFKNSAKKLR